MRHHYHSWLSILFIFLTFVVIWHCGTNIVISFSFTVYLYTYFFSLLDYRFLYHLILLSGYSYDLSTHFTLSIFLWVTALVSCPEQSWGGLSSAILNRHSFVFFVFNSRLEINSCTQRLIYARIHIYVHVYAYIHVCVYVYMRIYGAVPLN